MRRTSKALPTPMRCWRVCGVVVGALVALRTPVAAQPGSGELIERTLAIVGGQVITLSDVQTAVSLGLIGPVDQADAIGPGTSMLIERLLVLREVQRYAPPEPGEGQIDDQFARVQRRFPSLELFQHALARGGFSDARLRAWIRDDLRIASYLAQRFAAVGTPSDDEVGAYYQKRREEFDRQQMAFDAAAPIIRDRLFAERRGEVIADWIGDLRRRTTVVELWRVKD